MGDYRAFVGQRADQPIEAIASRAGLVAEMHAIEPAGDPLNNAAHARIRRVDLAKEANFSLPAGIRNRDGVLRLCDIDSDKRFPIICHGSSSCGEDRIGPPEQPSDAQCKVSHLTGRGRHMVLRSTGTQTRFKRGTLIV